MKYKALYSPKQFFSFKGSVLKAQNGLFETTDNEIINFLDGHFAWECLSKKELPKVEKKVKEVKENKKKGIKK